MSLVNLVPGAKQHRSTFNMSNTNVLTMPFANLVPIQLTEILPGDKFKQRSDIIARMQPMLAPIYANVRGFKYDFFVPNRILWANWEKFISVAPEDEIPVKPYFTSNQLLAMLQPLVLTVTNTVSGDPQGIRVGMSDNLQFGLQENGKVHFLDSSYFARISWTTFKTHYLIKGTNATEQMIKANINALAKYYDYVQSMVGDGSLFDYMGIPNFLDSAFVHEVLDLSLDNPQAVGMGISDWIDEPDFYHDMHPEAALEWVLQFNTDDYLSVDLGGLYGHKVHDFFANFFPFVYYQGSYSKEEQGDFVDLDPAKRFDLLPLLAYWRIYLDYFRDQNFEYPDYDDSVAIYQGNGQVSNSFLGKDLATLRTKCWQRDYFTSCLPTPQRGAESMVSGANTQIGVTNNKVNLENQPLFSIAELRLANSLQKFLEIVERGGHRYVETIKSFFGVTVPDYRLNRAQLLKGSVVPVKFDEIIQTSASQEYQPLGDYAGHGRVADGTGVCKYSSVEHGFYISILTFVPAPAYCQGVNKMWHRMDRYDYFFPTFENLGEEAVSLDELFASGDNSTFGYMPRYSDYKFRSNEAHGFMRSNMSFWNMVRLFDSKPSLGKTFLHVNQDDVQRPFPTYGASKLIHNKDLPLQPNVSQMSYTDNSISNRLYLLIRNNFVMSRPMRKYVSPSL